MTVGERIKQRRLELEMTQDELAKKLGYASRVSVNKYELGRTMPLDRLEKFAEVLQCSPSFLMGWDEGEQTDKEKLIDIFNELSEEGKRSLMVHASYLLQSERS